MLFFMGEATRLCFHYLSCCPMLKSLLFCSYKLGVKRAMRAIIVAKQYSWNSLSLSLSLSLCVSLSLSLSFLAVASGFQGARQACFQSSRASKPQGSMSVPEFSVGFRAVEAVLTGERESGFKSRQVKSVEHRASFHRSCVYKGVV